MNVKCSQCEKTESILWRKNSENGEICNECYESEKVNQQIQQEKEKEALSEIEKDALKDVAVKETLVTETKTTRKSTRSTRFKNKAMTRQKSKVTSRRSNTFKSIRPNKTPTNISAETKTKRAVSIAIILR